METIKVKLDLLQSHVNKWNEVLQIRKEYLGLEKLEPIIYDASKLRAVHREIKRKLEKEFPDYADRERRSYAIRVEMFVLLWAFAPVALIGRKFHLSIIKAIREEMGLLPQNFRAYKASLLDMYRLYESFRDCVNRITEEIIKKYGE